MVYALERRLTGTFELSRGAISMATILVMGGCPAKIRTSDPVHFLGNVLLELGMITPAHLQASLAQMQGRLQGQVLLQMNAIDAARLDAGLRSQVERKVEHLFGLSTDTTFAYYDNVDLLQQYGGPPTPIDPFPVLWRGCREQPAFEHVDATYRRAGAALLRVAPTAQIERFAFTPQEREAVEMLRHRPARAVDVAGMLGPRLGQTLVYFLMIMKQVDLIDGTQPMAPAQAAPAPAPAGPPPSAPGSARQIAAAAPAAAAPPQQQIARVQLQRQAAPGRGPMVVEEVATPSARDDRAAPPSGAPPTSGAFGASAFGAAPPSSGGGAFRPPTPPQAMSPAPAPVISAPAVPAGPLDIGSMIVQTIQQSNAPPAMPSAAPAPASAPAVPAAAKVPSVEMPAVEPVADTSANDKNLTAEQRSLKQKILDRAATITGQDYFQMLGVDRDASTEQIQKAFFGLAKVWHPDRLPPALIDVKDACSKVFTHLTEANQTLSDPGKRQDYLKLLKEGGATPEDQQKIQAILEAAQEFQKVEFLLKRNPTDPQAHELVRRCVQLDDEQVDYLATLAWLDAQKPEWLSREKTLEKAIILDRCIQKNPNCERAYFYRGMLYKRAEEFSKALKDFKKAAELNPRNLDAMREVRLHNMRGGQNKGAVSGPGRPSAAPAAAPAEKIGGFLGKLFKK
ncbi:MAG: DnaJ domain-containing protein [Labilithrix sp.]|nr:DnaJ domain-containing protein [Labilithrix sp.]MCW5810753.1 DnaJ domain-containing protein [Labilithrix sp.]